MTAMKSTIPVSTLVDLAAGRLEPIEALGLLGRLDRDSVASEILNCAIDLTAASHEEGDSFCPDHPSVESKGTFVPSASESIYRIREWSLYRFVFLGATIVLLFFMMVLSICPLADSLARRAQVTDDEVLFSVRGTTGNEIDVAMILLADHRNEDAAKLLEWFIRAFPTSPNVGRAHYLAGISWLRIGQHTILGLYPSIERNAVRKSIPHFDVAVELDPGSWSAMEADWYRTRAFLMVGETQQAISGFVRIIKSESSHSREAEHFLVSLNRMPNSTTGPN